MELTVSEERYMSLSYIDEGRWLLFNDVDPEYSLRRVNNCYISKKVFPPEILSSKYNNSRQEVLKSSPNLREIMLLTLTS